MKTCTALVIGALVLLLGSVGYGQDFDRFFSQDVRPRQFAWFWDKEQPKTEPSYTLVAAWPPAASNKGNQQVAENLLARNYVLIFDGSGSMMERRCAGGKRKIDVAKSAVSEWAKSIDEDANVGLVAFHENAFSRLPLAAKNRTEFLRVVSTINAGGGTPLGRAMQMAHAMLVLQARTQLGYGEYHIVVVTDGEANNPRALADAVDAVLKDSPIVIHTIGFCIDEKHSLNQPGRTLYKTADNPQELRRSLQEVLAELETFDVTTFGK